MVFDVLPPRRQCLRENKNDVLPLQRSRDLQGSWARGQKRMTQGLKMLLGVTSISLLTLPTISQQEQHQKLDFKIKIPPSQCWYFLKIPPSQSWYFSWTKDRKMGAGGGQWDRFFTSEIGTTHCFYSNQKKVLRPSRPLYWWLGLVVAQTGTYLHLKLKSRAIMSILALCVAIFWNKTSAFGLLFCH